MDVCLPVCKVGFSVSSLQSGVLSLQTGAGRKRCDLHVSRSANCDTQFANWCSLQIRRASLASSLHTELSSRLICKLRPSLQTAAKVSPSLQTGLSLQTAPVRRLRPTYRRRKDRLKKGRVAKLVNGCYGIYCSAQRVEATVRPAYTIPA